MRLTVLALVATLFVFPCLAQQNAFVIDSEGRAMATIDLERASVTSKVSLPFEPYRALLAPDGRSLLVLDRGAGTVGFWAGEFRPKGKSRAAILSGEKVIGQTELGWGLAEAAFSKDGTSAYVLTTGYESNKPAERKESELIRLDAATGQVAGRIAFDAAAEAFATDSTGSRGIVYSPAYPKKKPSPLPARVTFVDLKGFKAGMSIDLAGDVRKPVAVGDMLYVLDRGMKGAGGHLYVINTTSASLVKTIDLGAEAVMAGSDAGGRVFVLSQAADKKSGRVMIVKGTDVTAEYPGPAAPKFVSLTPDSRKLYVAGWKEFSVIDLESGKGSPAVELARASFSILPSRDGKRAFIVNMDGNQCCRITAFDVEGMKRLTTFLGGSKGERIGQGLAAVALTVVSYEAGRSLANASGSETFSYSIYAPTARGAARGPLAFGPGEKKVYLVDTQTNDVTIVDAVTGQRLSTLDAGNGLKEVVSLQDAGVVAGIADSAITLVDTTSDTVRTTIPMSGDVVDAVVTPDERRLVVFGKERIVIIDAASAKEIGRIESLKRPTRVLFPTTKLPKS